MGQGQHPYCYAVPITERHARFYQVQAVYPQFKRVEELALMTPNEILASNPGTSFCVRLLI